MSQFEVLGNFVYQTKNQLRNTENSSWLKNIQCSE